ncbi:MAG: tetratricopeptide repeat protein [Bacteroidota bacterium]
MISRWYIWGLFLLGSLCAGPALYAQVFEDQEFRQKAKQALDFTYNFEFERAHFAFQKLQKAYPDHPAPYYLLAFNRWWQSYISTTRYYHPFIEKQLSLALSHNAQYASLAEFRLEYTFFQYMIYAFQARLDILQREWISGANSGRKALPYLEKGLAFAQESPEFYFSSGIYHYFAETYPEKHSYLQPFMVFFPDGNAQLGVDELNKASKQSDFTQTESLFYLGDIYLEEGDLKHAIQLKRRLTRQYPRNTWFEADYARALVEAKDYSSATEILSSMQTVFEAQNYFQSQQISSQNSRYTSLLMVRVYHLLGRISLESEKDYEQALQYFDQSLLMIKLCGLEEYAYIPANHYYRGKALEAQHKIREAKEAFELVLKLDENEDIKAKASQALTRL